MKLIMYGRLYLINNFLPPRLYKGIIIKKELQDPRVMEKLEEDFIPDFKHLAVTGEISNRGSLIKQIGDLTYISVNNRLNIWNIRFSEIVETVCSLEKKITAFDYDDGVLVIGYENGVVQIHSERILSFRPHSKRVVRVIKKGDHIISASADSSIILYDLVSEEIKIHYEGNDSCVDEVMADLETVIAVCADNTLRVWDMESKDMKSMHIFEKPVKNVFVEDDSWIIFFRDGECVLYESGEKLSHHFAKFKKLRNVKREGKKLFVQCKNKLHVYEIASKEKVVLMNLETIGTNDRYVNFDVADEWGSIFVTNDNCWEAIKEGKIYSFGYHRSEILDFGIYDRILVTLSKESIHFWSLDDEKIEKAGNIQIKDGENICIWNSNVVVSGGFGFACYSLLNYDLIMEESLDGVSCVSTNENELAVGKDNTVLFYDKNYKVARVLETEELVSSLKMSKCTSILCVGLLNCKVYIYDLETLALKVVLYGHSLPVRSMALSPDNLELLTCGADKVVKMWGTEFGECRKTFIGDARNVEYLNRKLFMFSSGRVQYFRGHEKLKEFKHHSSNLVKVSNDVMVSCGRFNIDVYKMDKYEFEGCASSEEESDEILKAAKIVNYRKYDEFLLGLEKVSEEFSDENVESLFKALTEIDLCELDRFLCLLNSQDVAQLMNVIDVCSSWNIVLVAKVFISLTRLHKEICVSHDRFKSVVKSITEKILAVREQVGMNEGKLLTDRSLEDTDIGEDLVSTI